LPVTKTNAALVNTAAKDRALKMGYHDPMSWRPVGAGRRHSIKRRYPSIRISENVETKRMRGATGTTDPKSVAKPKLMARLL
jgi:hypothetical protein